MSSKILEDLRFKLLARLDSLNKKRGQFQDINAFIEFRNASGVQPGNPVNLDRFSIALKQLDVNGATNKAHVSAAFSKLTRIDHRSKTDDVAITFNHFKEWCAVRDANDQRAKRKKRIKNTHGVNATPRTSRSSSRSSRRGGHGSSELSMQLTGRSLNTGRRPGTSQSIRSVRSNQSNRSKRSNESNQSIVSTFSSTERKRLDSQMNTIISVDGHLMKMSELYGMLRLKIIGRHPGGSHGLLKCWSQFRHMAGSGRSGGKGAGFITKDELGVCFRNYGLELDKASDLDLIFSNLDISNNGVLELNDWIVALFGKWSTDVNSFGQDKEDMYEGLTYKPMEFIKMPVSQVFSMLRKKIERREKGGSFAARRGWNQFRTMSGGHPDGVNEEDLGRALVNYGMPVDDNTLKTVFNYMDIKKNGIITFSEFRESVLEKTDDETKILDRRLSGLLDASHGKKMGEGEGEEGAESKLVVPAFGEEFTDMITQMNISKKKYASSIIQPSPGSIHASIQEKMRSISKKNWRGLQKAFRRADGTSRTGELDLKTFAFVLSEYGVSFSREELRYASDSSIGGKSVIERGYGPKISEFRTLALKNASPKTKVVNYSNFLKKFVDSTVLLRGLRNCSRK